MISYGSFDVWWWPFLFILLAGILPTVMWRWAGVFLVGNLQENSPVFLLIRCIATALVAAVVSQLVFYPSGALASVPLFVRLAAAGIGFCAFFAARRSMFWAILSSQIVLVVGAMPF